jgi:hypothetical protein
VNAQSWPTKHTDLHEITTCQRDERRQNQYRWGHPHRDELEHHESTNERISEDGSDRRDSTEEHCQFNRVGLLLS